MEKEILMMNERLNACRWFRDGLVRFMCHLPVNRIVLCVYTHAHVTLPTCAIAQHPTNAAPHACDNFTSTFKLQVLHEHQRPTWKDRLPHLKHSGRIFLWRPDHQSIYTYTSARLLTCSRPEKTNSVSNSCCGHVLYDMTVTPFQACQF